MGPEDTKRVGVSFSQVQIYDRSAEIPACTWTSAHVAQGFVRRPSNASFITLIEAGYASVRAFQSSLPGDSRYERVICIPFYAPSGDLDIGAPDDWPHQNNFAIGPGYYRLCVAQNIVSDEEQDIDLFFEKLADPITHSTIVVCDINLNPPAVLLEGCPDSD